MAADALARQRRLLLPLALLLAGSAAVAGGLAVSLFSRPGLALAPARTAGPVACAPVHPPSDQAQAAPDPMAVLAAALGESRPIAPPSPFEQQRTTPLQGLLAASQDPPSAPPGSAPPAPATPAPARPNPAMAHAATPNATTPAGPAAAAGPATAAPALAAPVIAAGYRLDLGYFLAPDQAVAFATQVQDRGVPVQLVSLPDASGRVWTHIRTPPFAGSAQALAGAERIERALGIPTRLVAPDPAPPPTPAAGVPAP